VFGGGLELRITPSLAAPQAQHVDNFRRRLRDEQFLLGSGQQHLAVPRRRASPKGSYRRSNRVVVYGLARVQLVEGFVDRGFDGGTLFWGLVVGVQEMHFSRGALGELDRIVQDNTPVDHMGFESVHARRIARSGRLDEDAR
jgi:hypothetical protein